MFSRIVTLLLLVASSLTIAQTYRATIEQWLVEDQLIVDLYFETTSGTSDRLGDATLVLNYNQTALTFLSKDSRFDGLWDADYSPSYLDVDARSVNSNLSVNIGTTGSGIGVLIPETRTRVIRLVFAVNDFTAMSDILWNINDTVIYDWQGNPIKYKFFWIQPGPFPLPVELVAFEAISDGEIISLNWQTASETSNLGFNIYRAENASGPFEKINDTMIQGAGNSSSENNYKFIDAKVKSGKVYYYKLEDITFEGLASSHETLEIHATYPELFTLQQNHPNPFNPETQIVFSLQKASHIRIMVYNLLGQKVRTLIDQVQNAGIYSVNWDGLDDNGRKLSSGTFIYRLETDWGQVSKKMLLLQ